MPLWFIGLLLALVILAITAGLAVLHIYIWRVSLPSYLPLAAVARMVRLIFVLIVGLTLVFLGVAMMIGPGPGLLVILLGLAILATEFVWARVLLKRMQTTATAMGNRIGLSARTLPPDAGWFRRLTFNLGAGGRKLAVKLRLNRLVAWLDKRLGISAAINQPDVSKSGSERSTPVSGPQKP